MGKELRKTPRRFVSQPALMIREDGSIIGQCMLLDISAGGARLKLAGDVSAPAEFTLLLSKFNSAMRRQCKIAWERENQIGVRFQA
jgi:hypothetical protein